MACKELGTLSMEYLQDSSQFWGDRNSKRGSDFRHKLTREQPWLDNPPLVKEDSRRNDISGGEFCVRKTRDENEFLDRTALLGLIKACGKQKDLLKGSGVHTDILERGLLKDDISLGNALLSMYTKCGALTKAQEMFDELPARNVVTWNALIAGYAQNGLGDAALSCFERMQDEGFSPNAITFICILKACGTIGAAEKGQMIHATVDRQGLLGSDIVLGTALVGMYARCGMLAKAQGVFDELPTRDVAMWTALISGFVQHGLGKQALSCFERMRGEGISPDAVTFCCILKACGSIGAAEKGEEIHDELKKQRLLQKDIDLGNALVDMYAKCGALAKARKVFDKLPARNVVTWNVLIAGYAQHSLGDEALRCFGRMQDEGLSPNAVTYICILKTCGIEGALDKGEEIHAEVLRQGLLHEDIVLGTSLVDMYAKCGMLVKARGVFDELPARNVATWTALIDGYVHYGLANEALSCFRQMQGEGVSPNGVTFVCILRACGSIGAVGKGEEIHAEVDRQQLLEKDIMLGTALVDMYAKCGVLTKAQEVFNELPAHNVATWTALIAGYAQHGQGHKALSCFGQMQDEGISPNEVTFVCILKACSSIRAIDEGKEIHVEVDRQGLLETNAVLGTALVDLYAKCGMLTKAQGVFDVLPTRDVASWTALIAGYAQHGLGNEVLSCFGRMLDEGIFPNAVTLIFILKACGSIGAVEKGEEIHGDIERKGLLEKDIMLGTALVDMYAKCGVLAKVQEVFDKLPARDVASWNALIAGYVQHKLSDEALSSFEQMQEEGLAPNAVTFTCVLKACGCIGAAEKGKEIHGEVERQGLFEKDNVLGTAFVDMYAKCGIVTKAQEVFDRLQERDVAMWTVLIAGYAQFGNLNMVFNSFGKMIGSGVQPNVVTFVVLLTACSHAGLVEEGQMYFDSMSTVYCIMPTLEHCTCMVDIFSRAGQFEKSIRMIEQVPSSDRLLLWLVLMGACEEWVDVELGRWAFEHAVRLDERSATAYVCMSNLYSAAGMLE